MLNFLIPAAISALGVMSSNKATKDAANTAAQTADKNNAAIAAQNAQTRQDLQPYTQAGYGALPQVTNQLALSGPQADWIGYGQANPDVLQWATATASQPGETRSLPEILQAHYNSYGFNEGRDVPYTSGQYGTNGFSGQRDMAERPDAQPRPDYGDAPDPNDYFDMSKFQASPDYDFRQSQSMRALNSGFGAKGMLRSGGAIAGALQRSSDLASGEFGNWWNRQNTLYQTAVNQFNANRGFSNANYENDRNFLNSNYDTDMARSDARFDADRGFAANRFDTRTNDLMRLVGVGQSAAAGVANSGANAVNAMVANNNSAGSAQANAALVGAGQTNQLMSDALKVYGNFRPAQGNDLYGGTMRAQQYQI